MYSTYIGWPAFALSPTDDVIGLTALGSLYVATQFGGCKPEEGETCITYYSALLSRINFTCLIIENTFAMLQIMGSVNYLYICL